MSTHMQEGEDGIQPQPNRGSFPAEHTAPVATRVFNPGGEKFLIAALEKIAAMPPRLLPSQLVDQFIEMRLLAKRAIAYATTPLDCKSASGTPIPHQFLDRSGCCAMCGLAKADYLGEAEYGTAIKSEMEKAMGSRQNPLHPMFRDHNCAYCASGEKACKQGNPSRCEYPHARND